MEHMPGWMQQVEHYLGDTKWRTTVYDGTNYLIPSAMSMASTGQVMGLRADWMRAVGVEPQPVADREFFRGPDTIAEIEDLLLKFRNEDPDGDGQKNSYGYMVWKNGPSMDSTILPNVFGSYGVRLFTWDVRDGTGYYSMVDPNYREALKFVNRWWEMEIIHPDTPTAVRADVIRAMANDEFGAWSELDAWMSQYEAGPWGALREAQSRRGGRLHDHARGARPEGAAPGTATRPVRPPVFGIDASDEKVVKIMQMLEDIYADADVYAENHYGGREGETWELDANGYRISIPGTGGGKDSATGTLLGVRMLTIIPQIVEPVDKVYINPAAPRPADLPAGQPDGQPGASASGRPGRRRSAPLAGHRAHDRARVGLEGDHRPGGHRRRLGQLRAVDDGRRTRDPVGQSGRAGHVATIERVRDRYPESPPPRPGSPVSNVREQRKWVFRFPSSTFRTRRSGTYSLHAARSRSITARRPRCFCRTTGRCMPCGPTSTRASAGRLPGARTEDSRGPRFCCVPESWSRVRNAPTIYRPGSPRTARQRLFVFAGCQAAAGEPPTENTMQQSHSTDDGATWSPMASNGLECVMPFCSIEPTDGGSRLLGMSNIRRAVDREAPLTPAGHKGNRIAQSVSSDGGLTWSPWDIVLDIPPHIPINPEIVRSPDGSQLLCLDGRQGRAMGNDESLAVHDVGTTRGLPGRSRGNCRSALTGDRPKHRYAHDGRLVVTMRNTAPGCPDTGDLGRHGSVPTTTSSWGGRGTTARRLLRTHAGADASYPAIELLPDGTFVATTYIKYRPGKERHSIVSVRFPLAELDRKESVGFAAPAGRPTDYDA